MQNIKHKSVDWKHVFRYMDQVHYWSSINRPENVPLNPNQELTVDEFLELQFLYSFNWEWEFEFWGVPYRPVDDSESFQSVCKYIAAHTHVLELQTNPDDLFSCRPATFFHAIEQHFEQTEPQAEITPASEINSLNGRTLLQAYYEIFRSLPLPDKSPVEVRFIHTRPTKTRQWIHHILHEPIDLSTFSKMVLLPFAAIEVVLWFTFPMMIMIGIIIPLLCALIAMGITMMSDSYQTPENLVRLAIKQAPTLKDMCKLLDRGLPTSQPS